MGGKMHGLTPCLRVVLETLHLVTCDDFFYELWLFGESLHVRVDVSIIQNIHLVVFINEEFEINTLLIF